jgi:hypothetical protein
MAERRSSVRKATQRSKGEAFADYNDISKFKALFKEDSAENTPSASGKRSAGTGSLVTKQESDSRQSAEGLPTLASTSPKTSVEQSQENGQGQLSAGSIVEEAEGLDDSDLSELGTTPKEPTPAKDEHWKALDVTAQLGAVSEQLSENAISFHRSPVSPSYDQAVTDRPSPKPIDDEAATAPKSPSFNLQASDYIESANIISNAPRSS